MDNIQYKKHVVVAVNFRTVTFCALLSHYRHGEIEQDFRLITDMSLSAISEVNCETLNTMFRFF